MRKKVIIITGIVLLVGSIFIIYNFFFNKPLYQVGNISSGQNLSAPLTPPDQDENTSYFKVEDDIQLRYFTQGSGRNVLILHGGPGMPFAEKWPALDKLSDSYKFIYYDQRGSGSSTRPINKFNSSNYYKNMQELEKKLGLTAQVGDIERIRRILGEEKIILIGHSYGAFLASIYSAEFPDNIEALILVAPAPIFKMPLDIPDMYESVRNDLPEDELENYDEFLNRYFDYKNIFKKSEEELVSLNNEFMKYFLMAHQKYDVAQPKESNTGGWMVHAMYLSSGREYDYTQEISKVKVPTLIIHPGSDFIQNESARKMYLDIFPHAKYVVMEDAGHMAFYDKPDTFAKIVDDFLEENNLSNNDI